MMSYAIELLLEHDADPSIPDASGKLPIHLLLERQADTRPETQISQLVFDSEFTGNSEEFDRLTDTVDQLNAIARDNFDPLQALHSYLLLGEILTPDTNIVNASDASGRTLLHLALLHGQDYRVIRMLLGQGADTALVDRNGQSALHYLARQGDDLDTVTLSVFVSSEANFSIRDNDDFLPVEIMAQNTTDEAMLDTFNQADRKATTFFERLFR